jgi:hypothetical protein
MNFQQEVRDVLVTVGHSLQSFDFIVDPFRDGSSYPLLKVVQDKMPFSEELHCQFLEGDDV